MDGLKYALEIVERGGIEELKKEIRVRNAHFIPLEVSAKKANEISQVLANRILATFTPTVMFSLNQEFHFGKDRLLRWKDAFINLCDMMDAIDPFGCQYETARDYAEVLKQKYGTLPSIMIQKQLRCIKQIIRIQSITARMFGRWIR